MNRKSFFDFIRADLAKGTMNQTQVNGINDLLDVWFADFTDYPNEFLAYCLATAWHETAFTMQPIEEYGKGRGRKYGRRNETTGKAYYGRGYVQLTWGYNYKRAGIELGMGQDLFNHPEKVMVPETAAKILFQGSIEGWFTGKKLADYIGENSANYRQCRRIINGMDKASQIAKYASIFEHAIEQSKNSNVTEEKLLKAGSKTIQAAKSNKDAGGAVIGVGVVGGAVSTLDKVKELAGKTSEWRTVLESMIDALSWGLQYWWVAALTAGGVLYWNNRTIIKARIRDELKIGRIADDPTD